MPLEPRGSGWRRLLNQACFALAQAGGRIERRRFDGEVADKACAFLDMVVEWNRQMDLTAAHSAEELVDIFFADALIMGGSSDCQSIVDVGSGAGAPGVPLKILRPDLSLTLVEPKTKRVAFLRSVAGSLGLDYTVLRERAEALEPGGWDAAVSRATMSPEAWLEQGALLARRAVWLLLAKAEEPHLVGWAVDRNVQYFWPLTGAERRAVRYARRL